MSDYITRGYESQKLSLSLLKFRVNNYLHKPHISSYDLEVTNACNTSCIFCPRDKIGKKGFIDANTYKKAIQRAQESGVVREIQSAGLGEPLLHREIVDFVRFTTDQGLASYITTNASLLNKRLASELIDSGLKGVFLSVSGLNNTYEEIHKLDFEVTKKNILDFIDISKGRCKVTIAIVICEKNYNEIDKTIKFWKNNGISNFQAFTEINRGGALEKASFNYLKSERLYVQAVEILQSNNITTICEAPFLFWFVGWDGNYYLCCHDYSKELPLGNVFDKSMQEIIAIKERCLSDNPTICRKCSLSPISRVMDVLSRIERQEAKQHELEIVTKSLKTGQVKGKLLKKEIINNILKPPSITVSSG